MTLFAGAVHIWLIRPQDEKFIAIGAGAAHSCGITAGNDVFCWGSGSPGSTMPPAGGKYIAISSGQAHNCAITFDNDAVCWGLNSNRQSAPPAGRKFIAIGAGFSHSCGITTDNKAVCWGSNGSDRANPANSPQGIDANTRFLAVSAGHEHSCGIKADGAAVCWGLDNNSRTNPAASPQGVNAGARFLAISAGGDHTCGITYDNGIACWGSAMHNRTSPPQIHLTAADPVTIAATVSDADRGQLIISGDGQAIIPAGETQIILTVTAADDNISEPETVYAIALSAAGHTELEEDELIVTVPVDSLDPVEDIDDAENAVAENSPIGTMVGITVRSSAAATYTLTDSADGLFAIHPQSGVVSVAADMLNYEAFSSHTIIAQARNNTSRQILPLIIRVTDEPEPVGHLTDIDLSPNKISYGAKRGDAVGIIARAIDPDRGSEVTYSLSKNAGGLFAIGEHDGCCHLGLRRLRA